MKTMTCKQLGGACDMEFHADTFELMAEMSRNHGFKMLQEGDTGHILAMEKMKVLMQSPTEMKKWMDGKIDEFNNLP